MRGFQGRRNRTYTRKIGSTEGWTEEEKKQFREEAIKVIAETKAEVKAFNKKNEIRGIPE